MASRSMPHAYFRHSTAIGMPLPWALAHNYLKRLYQFSECEVFEDEGDIELFDQESCENVNKTKHSTLVMWLVYLIATLQRKHYISNTAIAPAERRIWTST